ncbi:LysR family transcriptional regulator [Komagataeibacter nataicola]|uniref:LysR family transcriptional regulator n=1 Tax=Komagataeibacter nataicola TaxID=265960 RepID=UPI0023DD43AC|nr:LysR family transcriptional regulator [Komagataeibacter nataicola]WEQ54485.1 LysR family transcriptional regulator [Komagataeibacter nataicola]
MMIDFKSLEAVVWIDRLGSFKGAAEALRMTQPAISVRISQIERLLDAQLFYRTPKSVTLTPVGVTFLHYATQMLNLREELVETIRGHNDERGILRIGAMETVAHSWLPEFLREVGHKYPNMTVDLEISISEEIAHKITKGMLDIGFFIGPVNSPKMIESELCSYETALVGARDLFVETVGKIDLHRVPSISIITLSRNTLPHSTMRNFLAREDIIHHRINAMSSIPTILTMLLQGESLAFLPRAVMEDHIRKGDIRVIDTGMKLPLLRCVAGRLISHGSRVIEDVVSIAERLARATP